MPACALSSKIPTNRWVEIIDNFNQSMSFTEPEAKLIKVLVMSFAVLEVGLNLWAQCCENLVIKITSSYALEYQG